MPIMTCNERSTDQDGQHGQWMGLERRTKLCRRGSAMRDSEVGRWNMVGHLVWQREYEARRAVGHVVEADVAAELAGEAPGDGQAQAPAAAGLATGIEPVEPVLPLVGRRPGALVFPHHLHATLAWDP